MENEIRSLLAGYADDIERTVAMRGLSERKDSYGGIIREVLSASSLCYIRRSRDAKDLCYFDGRAYVATNLSEAKRAVLNLMHERGVVDSDLGRIGDIPFYVLDEKVKNVDRNKVAFTNLVYDVPSGGCSEFSADAITDYELPYAFDPLCGRDRWMQFLDEVLPDKSMQMCLQEFFGMCFIDRRRISIEKMALFIGKGANGKSVVCETIKNVLGGNDKVDNLSPDQLQDPKQVVSLNGKVLNIAPDVRKGAAFDSCLKALSSAQTVQGWAMYKGNQDVVCPPLAFALNELPVSKDTTSGFFRRILLFSFNYTVPEERQDKLLSRKLVDEEASGIFRWIMEGRERLVRNKGQFTPCPQMDADMKAMEGSIKTEQSPVLQYLQEAGWSITPCYEGQMYEKIPASEIFEGLNQKIKKYNITKELNKYGVQSDRGKELRYFLYKIQ